MRILISLSILLSSCFAQASALRVMSFNVMCDFCKSTEASGNLRTRLPAIADTILRYRPDLISLQELRNANQVERLLSLLGDEYEASYPGNAFLNYADETLLFRRKRFAKLKSGGRWLGPKARFNLGWKAGIPRRFEFVDLEDLQGNLQLRFAGAHFDNAKLNKEQSAKVVSEFLSSSPLPVIFAADTNLTPESEAYAPLIRGLRNSFDEAQTVRLDSKNQSRTDLLSTSPAGACFAGMTERFPACRIDHVLLSNASHWKVKSWSLDLFQYSGSFASDHRALVVDLEQPASKN